MLVQSEFSYLRKKQEINTCRGGGAVLFVMMKPIELNPFRCSKTESFPVNRTAGFQKCLFYPANPFR